MTGEILWKSACPGWVRGRAYWRHQLTRIIPIGDRLFPRKSRTTLDLWFNAQPWRDLVLDKRGRLRCKSKSWYLISNNVNYIKAWDEACWDPAQSYNVRLWTTPCLNENKQSIRFHKKIQSYFDRKNWERKLFWKFLLVHCSFSLKRKLVQNRSELDLYPTPAYHTFLKVRFVSILFCLGLLLLAFRIGFLLFRFLHRFLYFLFLFSIFYFIFEFSRFLSAIRL